MAAASYSFLDVAVLDEVRGRFATGDALVILSADLDEVIWANGPGAALFGHPDIMAAIGAPSKLGIAARRQIAATPGFPAIGRDRAILMRMAAGSSSRAAPFLASGIILPDGEAAILLAAPAATGGGRSDAEIARRAIGGFSEAGHFVAFVDEHGSVEASSDGFCELGIEARTLASAASELGAGRFGSWLRLDSMELADIGCLASQPAFCHFEQHERLRLVHFKEYGRVNVDADQHEARIVRCPMPGVAFFGKPRPPIRRV